MSAYREIELRCDGGEGPYDCEPPIHHFTAEKARKEARESGWLVSQTGGKDYCPEHRKERRP